MSNGTFNQNVLKSEYPNQNDIWFNQKWRGVPILFKYPMGFIGQNGIWPSQKWQKTLILCKYPRDFIGQNGTWLGKKKIKCLYWLGVLNLVLDKLNIYNVNNVCFIFLV